MKPFPVAILVGIAFASGMLVPLVGLHATDDFERLPPVGALLWGNQARVAESTDTGAAADDALAFVGDGKTDLREASAEMPAMSARAAAPAALVYQQPAPAANQTSAPEGDVDDELTASVAASGTAPADGFTDADIADIQTLLKIRGYDPGPIDGRMGPGTAQAIREFEQAENMPVTGTPTPKLVAVLSAANDGLQTADTQTASSVAARDSEAPREAQAAASGPVRLVP